jgi:hypothetical protein
MLQYHYGLSNVQIEFSFPFNMPPSPSSPRKECTPKIQHHSLIGFFPARLIMHGWSGIQRFRRFKETLAHHMSNFWVISPSCGRGSTAQDEVVPTVATRKKGIKPCSRSSSTACRRVSGCSAQSSSPTPAITSTNQRHAGLICSRAAVLRQRSASQLAEQTSWSPAAPRND